MIIEDKLKCRLKDIYFDRYMDKNHCHLSAYFFVLNVIRIIYRVVGGDTGPADMDAGITEVVEEGLGKGVNWNLLSEWYEEMADRHSRKKRGQFYTPQYVAKFIVDRLLQYTDVVENPVVRVMDPSCGGGIFLTEFLKGMKDMLSRHLEEINRRHPHLDLVPDRLDAFVSKNIYGMDSDPLAVELTKLQLRLKGGLGPETELHIYPGNFLTSVFFPQEDYFDIVLGNPPYIGHKQLPMDYRRRLQHEYPGVLVDKGDISYCFIKKGVDVLRKGGYLSYIISRYFMEAPGGTGVRKFLKSKGHMAEIVDFYGNRILEGIKIDPLIFFFRKEEKFSGQITRVTRVTDKKIKGSRMFASLTDGNETGYRSFEVKWDQQDDRGWRMIPESHQDILRKIEKQCGLRLKDVVTNFQGIITGCDAAFIVNEDRVRDEGLERDLLKGWIKNSSIGSFEIDKPDKFILYTDLIKDADEYPNIIKHVLPFRSRLERRRECLKGSRLWYQLQWGRSPGNFERSKIVYPYKASRNRFAIDYNGYYFSADVYGFYIKEGQEKDISLEYLTGLLNSSLYDFYFKCFGKKLGADLYEYYPNTVLQLGIKVDDVKGIEEIARSIVSSGGNPEGFSMLDERVYRLFSLNDSEIAIIKDSMAE